MPMVQGQIHQSSMAVARVSVQLEASASTAGASRGLRAHPEESMGKASIQMAQMSVLQEQFTGRQWLAHSCKERDRKRYGGMWLTSTAPSPVSVPIRDVSPPQKQSLNPVVPRIEARPLGRGDCIRHQLPGKCKKCGAIVKETHLMLRVISGAFCERCCPACHPVA
jgi:hypothetical protein